jgi:hypothetical protein
MGDAGLCSRHTARRLLHVAEQRGDGAQFMFAGVVGI